MECLFTPLKILGIPFSPSAPHDAVWDHTPNGPISPLRPPRPVRQQLHYTSRHHPINPKIGKHCLMAKTLDNQDVQFRSHEKTP